MEIFNSLKRSLIVQKFEVLDHKRWRSGRYIRLKIMLKDKSILFVREYLDENERNYSFHWQDKNDRLIIRWDNAQHHKDIKTYPHHKHTGETITESFEISLGEVLAYIEEYIE
ncbi:MAG: DUF6516 family protein [Deltaproteobacteria bacterium]|nr:DUF6516 family protein [Deltaproteobacteria bacterium]